MGDLHTDRAFIRVKTKKPKMYFCVSGMTNRWRVSGVVINIKVFTMRVNLIKFLFHVDFFIEIAIHLPPSLSILMLPLTVLIPKANVSERKQFFLLFFFFYFFVFDNLFFHSLISSEVFFKLFLNFSRNQFFSACLTDLLTDDPVTVFLITLSYMYKQDAESINAVLSRDFDPMDRCHLQQELTISGFLLSSDTC